MKYGYLDLLVTEEVARARARRAYFQEWLWMMLFVTIILGIIAAAVWFFPMESSRDFKTTMTGLMIISWSWLGWDTSHKWRKFQVSEDMISRIKDMSSEVKDG